MLKLNDLVPTNLAEEKERFYAQNCDYNPQFSYQKRIKRHQLLMHGKPRWRYLRLAKKILKQAKKQELFIREKQLSFPQQEELALAVKNYLRAYDLQDKYQVKFDHNFISRFAVNFKDNQIKIRLPITLPKKEINSILNHEIGTHVLRQENYLQQPWYRKKRRYGFAPHIKTEEGLAVLNTLISKANKLAAIPALTYVATKLGLKKDFKSVYAFFYEHFLDHDRAWTYTFKNKRGLRDTGYPSCFTKSVNYFEGFVDVLKYLRRHDYNPTDLYYGKLAIEDIAKAKKIKPGFKPMLPKFYTDNPQLYETMIRQVARVNHVY